METKHTPGPWQVTASGIYTDHTQRERQAPIVGAASISRTIGREEADANECLIAAAPDLLAALQALSNAAKAHDDACPAPRSQKATYTWAALYGAVLYAQSAIAKAEGGK